MKLSARFVSFPTYFFCSVSGRDMSGNFRPTNLERTRHHRSSHKREEIRQRPAARADVPRIPHEEVVLLWRTRARARAT